VRTQPILFDAIDSDAYVPRIGVERQLLKAVESGERGILLIGPAGSGRTTTLNWLRRQLEDRRTVARVDAGVLQSPAALLDAVRVALAETSGEEEAPLDAPAARVDAQTEPVRLQGLVRSFGAVPPAVVAIDNLTHPGTIRAVFGGLRELLWETRHTYVVSVRPLDLAVFLTPPADSFFRRRVELAPLTELELRALVGHGEQPEAAWRRIRGQVRHQPRDVIAALRAEEPATDPSPAADSLSPTLKELWTQLISIDRPVTLHDDDFMAQVRRPPNTVRRQLNALVDAGLVVRLPDRTGQPGRPAVAYQARRGPA